MRLLLIACGIAASAFGCAETTKVENPTPPAAPWLQYTSPEQVGWSSDLLEAAYLHADAIGSGAVMVMQGDAVVAAWGDVQRKFRTHSIRKMLLSALYGIAVEEGFVDLHTSLEQLGIDDISALSAQEKSATIEQLLMSASGVYHPAAAQEDVPPPRGSQAPGAVFWYNNWDFNTLGRIYRQLTAQDLFEALQQRIVRPLGMQDFELGGTFYQYERHRSVAPAYHLRMSARDLARFGLMMLRGGMWQGKQVVPRSWVTTSTSAHIAAGNSLSFGYMWWVLEAGFFEDHPNVEAVLASGTGGQRLVFVPALDVVIVHRADTDYARGVSPTWPLVNMILSARTGEPSDDAQLAELAPQPFSRSLPRLELPVRSAVADAVLDRYAGKYETLAGPETPPGLEVCVQKLDDFLVFYVPAAAVEADFFPESDTSFFTRLRPVRMVFETEGERVTGLTITDPASASLIHAVRVNATESAGTRSGPSNTAAGISRPLAGSVHMLSGAAQPFGSLRRMHSTP